MPSQRHITPVNPSDISKAVLALVKVEPTMSANTVVSPVKALIRAATNPVIINPAQILFNIFVV
jgi:hypothetical protein